MLIIELSYYWILTCSQLSKLFANSDVVTCVILWQNLPVTKTFLKYSLVLCCLEAKYHTLQQISSQPKLSINITPRTRFEKLNFKNTYASLAKTDYSLAFVCCLQTLKGYNFACA